MIDRGDGFYWAKYRGEWIPGEYHNDSMYPWQLMACDEIFEEDELEEIGDEIELPDKHKQCQKQP